MPASLHRDPGHLGGADIALGWLLQPENDRPTVRLSDSPTREGQQVVAVGYGLAARPPAPETNGDADKLRATMEVVTPEFTSNNPWVGPTVEGGQTV